MLTTCTPTSSNVKGANVIYELSAATTQLTATPTVVSSHSTVTPPVPSGSRFGKIGTLIAELIGTVTAPYVTGAGSYTGGKELITYI